MFLFELYDWIQTPTEARRTTVNALCEVIGFACSLRHQWGGCHVCRPDWLCLLIATGSHGQVVENDWENV